jgi:hypothetical protein
LDLPSAGKKDNIPIKGNNYRPMIVGSSAIAISSVGALFPFRLRE